MMGPEVVTVAYGREALRALAAEVARAKGDDPLAPVTVVVPTNAVGVSVRRSLAAQHLGGRPGVAAVTFVTLFRLAELLGGPRLAAAGKRPISTPVLAAAVRVALRQRPGVLAAVADHPATERALVSAHRELGDLDSSALDRLAQQGARARAVVGIHRAVRATLGAQWHDEHDLVRAAAATVAGSPQHGASHGVVIVYLPQRFTTSTTALLSALALTTPVVVLVGRSGAAASDDLVLGPLARSGAPVGTPVEQPMPAPARVIAAPDSDDEVRAVVRAVLDQARAGTPLDRMAVVYGAAEPYARLLHEHLGAADVPVNGAPVDRLADSRAGRVMLGLLRLPDRDLARTEVLAWLAHASVADRHGRPVPVAEWARIARAAGVSRGASQWQQRLERYARELDHKPGRQHHAETARSLAAFVASLAVALDSAPTTWSGAAAWALTLSERFVGSREVSWPPVEGEAADRVDAAIERLGGLDAVDPMVDREAFTRALELELDGALPREGRIGHGVLVGPVASAVGVDVDAVFVVGMAEGLFPSRRRDDALLPDHERKSLGGLLPTRAERLAADHGALRAVVSAPTVTLSWPRGDLRRTTARIPSRWLLDAVGTKVDRRVRSDEMAQLADADWYENVASFAGAVGSLAVPATAQEHRLRSLLADDVPLRRHALARTDSAIARATELLEARASAAFTRFDGNLAGLPVPSPLDTDGVTSATRLERWATCPLAYLMTDILRVAEIDEPDEQPWMSPLDRGSLMHRILERFVAEALASGAVPAPGQDWSSRDLSRLEQIMEEECAATEAAGITGRTLFWQRDRAVIRQELMRFLALDAARRAALRSVPEASELTFGPPDRPVSVPLGDGRAIGLRGAIDRLDRTDDGLLVIDYKTGKSTKYHGLSAADPDARGTRLQLALYAEAARALVADPTIPIRSEYWFVSAAADEPYVGYLYDVETGERVRGTLGMICDGIAQGLFPAHPVTPSTRENWNPCVWCDPDGRGRGEVYARWLAKREASALAPYVALAEPERLIEVSDGAR